MTESAKGGGLVGRTIGGYQILESLGSGGMGQVYLALDPRLERRVALKVLTPEVSAHPEKIARFQREARAVASLSHPGIVTLYTPLEEDSGLRFMTMELVEGETLSKSIPSRGFPIERFLSLAIGLTDAVSAAHQKGILHRDLKPDNVMLTPDGRLKVLDFGLAKLRYDEPDGDHTMRETQSVTQDGRIVGTVAYMSPEQAQGLPLDHRSDVFSLGIMLYEMATGERPFRGNTNLSVLSSILKDSPRPASELRDEIPRPLARMIQRALEKRPEDRYQSTTDLRRDLEDLKRDVDTGDVPLRSSTIRRRLLPATSKRGLALKLATAAALVVVAGMVAVFSGGRTPADAGDGRRSLAVLYFDNITGDPGLDWLRTGLTDMLVTNLSQASGLRVLSTQRLYQILADAGHKDDRSTTGDAVAAVARESQATTAIVGSYVRAGARIRIQASLQDARTGETIASERVEGDAEQGLFALVDELTTRIRKRLEAPSLPRFAASGHRKKLQEVTTSSVEAYKAYAEGSRLHERMQEREALGYFEKAVEADPGFAMALAKLSVVSANLGDVEKAREYSAKAVEHAQLLPPGERYYIEGRHYSLDPRTAEKAVAAYEKAVDEAPDHTAARNNLAQSLIELRRYPEALGHLEELRRRGMSFPGSYSSLAETYVATGQVDRAREALTGYVAEHPDSAAGLENLGFFELSHGSIDDALAAFERAAALEPDERMKIEMGRATAHALRDEWDEVEGCAKRLSASSDPRERWSGGATLAIASLYRGDVGEARRLAILGAKTGETSYERAAARLFHARLEADLGSPKAALAEASRAAAESGGEPRLRAEGYAMKAVCLEKLGRHDEAKRSAAEVQGFLATLPKAFGEPARHRLEGELALARGDHEAARRALAEAAKLMPERTTSLDHGSVEIDFALARAALAAGDHAGAREALERVIGSGPKRVSAPVAYVRSLALLAELEEKQGRAGDARKLYERYLGYWKHGQIDRAEVARAGQRLAALRSKPAA